MGKIGKPQKSRKHKKVLPFDPSLEGDRKSFRQDKTANKPPKNEEEQEIPRKLQYFIDHKGSFPEKKVNRRNRFKKQKNDDHAEKGMTKPMMPAPRFIQHRNESEGKFMARVDRETKAVILTSQLSDKYQVDFEELENGNITKKKKKMNSAKKMRLKEKKTHKKEKKLEHQMEKKGDFSYLNDKVRFGEVAMAPPTLKIKPKKAPGSKDAIPRPGKKSLLLKEIIAGNAREGLGRSILSSREVGQTLKRKQMSLSQQHTMDSERNKAIKLYRQLRDKQNKTPS
ncbi:coiled-coil domain-containing protein 137-like [Ylistrum balloti]|uniref:coiled-coil domain-containing protein 137-like n=1 Tax=Ylistrum balloti TaxID=509963 RepID=UPI002905E72E|nr:coiled-coil domain-containing protein 137-like [Ylistrum balloti]